MDSFPQRYEGLFKDVLDVNSGFWCRTMANGESYKNGDFSQLKDGAANRMDLSLIISVV